MAKTKTISDERAALTVSELTAQLKDTLEGAFPSVWVSGEISNFSRPQSGHCYLTLKDDGAQLRAVVWRTAAARLDFALQDGLEVLCHGRLDLYPPRGSYQLSIDQMLPKGAGALELALRRLREKLAGEGLFDPDHKKPLPPFARRVAVVTSPTGAAVRDFLEVLRRRWTGIEVLVVPVRVQGDGAAREIADAIAAVNRFPRPPDVLVVTRGGGSLEDLWAFNEEPLVRAVFASLVPVVSAVGHEIDVTLCDLAADVRALTPSEAAERIVPDGALLSAAVAGAKQRLAAALRRRAAAAKTSLEQLASSVVLREPMRRIEFLSQRLDDQHVRIRRAMGQRSAAARRSADSVAARLESLSPLGVLRRGYTVTLNGSGQLIRHASDVAPGDPIVTRFADSKAISRVESVEGAESS